MSKRLGNAVDPFSTIEEFGSDPLRWYMITNSSPWDNLKFDAAGVREVSRKFFGTLYNTYSFFALYANVDGFEYKEKDIPVADRPEIDRWILSLLNSLIKECKEHFEAYEPTRAGRAIQDFVCENLSNWYVRLNRKRYWGGEYNNDKISAYQTLYTCLITVAKLMAPIAPFFADQLYKDLNKGAGKEQYSSVHLAQFPSCCDNLIDKNLEECMQLAQQSSSMILALRRKADKKVRQPLQKAIIPAADEKMLSQLNYVADLIKTEVNIKELEIVTSDNTSISLVKRIKPNFKTLGKKFGKQMKEIASVIATFSQEDISRIEKDGNYTLNLNDGPIVIEISDVEIATEDMPGWLVANEGTLTIALDVTVTEHLRREGVARELINRIQNIRKDNGYEITDKIVVKIEALDQINDAVKDFSQYIAQQTLATEISVVDKLDNPIELDFDDYKVNIFVSK